MFFNRLRYPPYSLTNIDRLVWLSGRNTKKKTPRDLMYLPSLLFGFLGSFTMKVNHILALFIKICDKVTTAYV